MEEPPDYLPFLGYGGKSKVSYVIFWHYYTFLFLVCMHYALAMPGRVVGSSRKRLNKIPLQLAEPVSSVA
jgi:hypothetical protein